MLCWKENAPIPKTCGKNLTKGQKCIKPLKLSKSPPSKGYSFAFYSPFYCLMGIPGRDPPMGGGSGGDIEGSCVIVVVPCTSGASPTTIVSDTASPICSLTLTSRVLPSSRITALSARLNPF